MADAEDKLKKTNQFLTMKTKNVLIAILCVCASTSFAQTSDAEAEAIINLLGVQKREAIAHLVNVSGKDSLSFWKIYDQYQAENKKTALTRIKLYEETAMSYSKMTPARADSLSAQYFFNRGEQEKMLESYYKKIKTATNAIVAFEFFQAEVYLLNQIRTQIMMQIPTYGQLQLMSKQKR